MSKGKLRIGVIGASGYTGSDLVRLAVRHPRMEISVLTANTHAGKTMEQVFPHLGGLGLPDLVTTDDVDWETLDAVFCGLPHATSQEIISQLPEHLKVIDMSADFRLRDPETYAQWYGNTHAALELQKQAVYGLSEHYRDEIAKARLVACPGCYPTAALNLLLPVLAAKAVNPDDIIIDAKSGVSGAGRSLKQNVLFCEAGEGMSAYATAKHRHSPEIEQELSLAAGKDVLVNFTPHLVPMSRCEYLSVYARIEPGKTASDIRDLLNERYKDEPFVRVLDAGAAPATQHIRGSNYVLLSVHEDRIPGRVIMFATLDNLVKGSAGQAIQNFNLMFGIEETAGLEQVALFP